MGTKYSHKNWNTKMQETHTHTKEKCTDQLWACPWAPASGYQQVEWCLWWCMLIGGTHRLLNRHKMSTCIYFNPGKRQKTPLYSTFYVTYSLIQSHTWILNSNAGKLTSIWWIGRGGNWDLEVCVCVCVPTSNQCDGYWLHFWEENK